MLNYVCWVEHNDICLHRLSLLKGDLTYIIVNAKKVLKNKKFTNTLLLNHSHG